MIDATAIRASSVVMPATKTEPYTPTLTLLSARTAGPPLIAAAGDLGLVVADSDDRGLDDGGRPLDGDGSGVGHLVGGAPGRRLLLGDRLGLAAAAGDGPVQAGFPQGADRRRLAARRPQAQKGPQA